MPERAFGKYRAKHELRTLPARIVESHGEFSANDLLFLDVLVLGKRRIHHRIGEDCHCLRHSVRRSVDPIHGPVETRISVDVAAAVLDLTCDVAGFAILSPFKKHVLEDMRKSRAHPFALVDAAGGAPCLDTGNRRAVVLFDDEGEAIFQGEHLGRAIRQGRHGGTGILRRSVS